MIMLVRLEAIQGVNMLHVRQMLLSSAKRGVQVGLLAAGCLLVGAAGTHAASSNGSSAPGAAGVSSQAVVPVDDTWQPFGFGGVGSTVGPFDFTSLVPVRLKVTDGYLIGDRFEIFDNAVSLGQTSTPAASGDCGSDPDICYADPNTSHASILLPPGSHSITITATASPFGGGGAFYRLTEETPPLCGPVLAPRGCWHFDETSGTVASDSSTFLNHGTYLGGPTLGVPGVFNTAVSLDGFNDSVRVPDANSLDVGDSFSLEGWIKRSSTAKSHTMFNKGGSGFQLVVMNAGSGNLVYLRKANVTTIATSTAPVPADNAYHHVVATKNGTAVKIYVDGVPGTAPVSLVQVVQNTASPLQFGDGGTVPANYDEFAVYDQVLTDSEVAARYAAGAPGTVAAG